VPGRGGPPRVESVDPNLKSHEAPRRTRPLETTGIDHVNLSFPADRLSEVVEFYVDALGFTTRYDQPHAAVADDARRRGQRQRRRRRSRGRTGENRGDTLR